jgi:hypothetical protein
MKTFWINVLFVTASTVLANAQTAPSIPSAPQLLQATLRCLIEYKGVGKRDAGTEKATLVFFIDGNVWGFNEHGNLEKPYKLHVSGVRTHHAQIVLVSLVLSAEIDRVSLAVQLFAGEPGVNPVGNGSCVREKFVPLRQL